MSDIATNASDISSIEGGTGLSDHIAHEESDDVHGIGTFLGTIATQDSDDVDISGLVAIDNSGDSHKIVAGDHGAASLPQVVNVCFGTGDPPTASGTPIGTLFFKHE